MDSKSYYLQRTDNGTFFTGYDIGESSVRFYHNPIIARKFSKEKAQELANHLPDAYRDLWGVTLNPQPVEQEYIKGEILSYFLFDEFLLICRNGDRAATAEWEEIYNSERSHENKWSWLISKDRANGRIYMIDSGDLGALTEAPMLGFHINIVDTLCGPKAELGDNSRAFWFSDYQTTDELEILHEFEHVRFDQVEFESKTTEK